MRVSLNWLNEYVKIDDLSPEELADKLDLTGTAVEGIDEPAKGLDRVIVSQILKIKPHPNADKLTICEVTTGKQTLDIVCGARNMAEGDKVPLALVGAVLPGGFKIKKASLRGVESNGMLCSKTELQIGEDASGLMILPADLKVGQPLAKAMQLDDVVIELEITPNRPDCLGMIGMAREIGAILGRPYKIPEIDYRVESKEVSELVSVKIENPELCPRYAAKVITDVKIGQSPDWMKRRLIAAGVRPINNIVDITNYVLFEYCQPLHAFDYELVKDGKIVVRRANKGEKITTLDDIERSLNENNLLITDSSGPIALAGVMGGATTEVSTETKIVLLESAYFDPKNISRTSRNLGLISESSMRFERGIDPNGCAIAADRAAQLMADIAGGKVLKGTVDIYPKKINPVTINLSVDKTNQVLGTDIKNSKIEKILESLDLNISKDKSSLNVKVPTFRPDLEREIDLIEEVARLYGLNNIESTLPESSGKHGELTREQKIESRVKQLLVSTGLMEAITYSFQSKDLIAKLPVDQDVVAIANPLSEDHGVLRTTLLPGLLSTFMFNVNRGQDNVKLFELGKVFLPNSKLPKEPGKLGIIIGGSWQDKEWHQDKLSFDFYDLKGILELIFDDLKVSGYDFSPKDYQIYKQGRSASIVVGSDKAGHIGELTQKVLDVFELSKAVYYAEVDMASLMKSSSQEVAFVGVPKYPGIDLDVAILVNKEVANKDIMRAIKEAGQELLKTVRLFDLYTGKGIPDNKKSLAFSLYYQNYERTLKMEEALLQHKKVKKALEKEVSAEIR
ncbi:MAG: phenylalanine--tRNA ligase subunit beta [Actinobacteria bacterium]|nr:MAG: phenylalanine--tRNA ligase subunit beta [Actinomycetota bacterium]